MAYKGWTGSDVNLLTCRAEGYPVVKHFDVKPKKGKDYQLEITNTQAWNDNGRPMMGYKGPRYLYFGMISYEKLWESFVRAGDGIKSYCDFDNCPIPSPEDDPSFDDFVNLAGIVHSYCGIP